MTKRIDPPLTVETQRSLRSLRRNSAIALILVLLLCAGGFVWLHPFRGERALLAVTYDASREFFAEIKEAYETTAPDAAGDGIQMFHAGSVRQAHNIISGLVADVALLASPPDLDAVASKGGPLAPSWRQRLPHGSSPYTSTIVFLVRRGNPKQVRDWTDLSRPDVAVVAPNPSVSGAGRLAYLAYRGAALARHDGDEGAAHWSTVELFLRVDSPAQGARQVLHRFAQQATGDVLLTWENEAHEAARGLYPGSFEIVYPSSSVLAEPSVAVLDRFVDTRGTRPAAEQLVAFLFSDEGQLISARRYLRPRSPAVARSAALADIELFTMEERFGGWSAAWTAHFAPGGSYAQIEQMRRLRR